MRWIRNIGLGLVLMVAVNACFTPPDFPITPQIEFINNELKFIKNPDPQGLDTLRVVLKFTDGDGDIGFPEVGQLPLKDQAVYYYLLNANGQVSLTKKEQSNINYRFKRLNPNFRMPAGSLFPGALLPDFVPPFSCSSWELKRVNNIVTDTVYLERNPNHFNIFVDYFTKNNDGTFTRFDVDQYFLFPFCNGLVLNASRIPNLSKEIGKNSPLDGKIKFNIVSLGAIDFIFSIRTLKLKVYIVDRAGNKSNEVESKEFTLQSIR
jgi:hypothetical protein